MTETRSLFGAAGGIFGLRLTAAGSAYLTQVALARWLGSSALGTYVFAASLLVVLGTLSGLGLPAAAPRFLPRYAVRGEWASVGRYLRFSRIVAFALGSVVGVVGWLTNALGVFSVSDATLIAFAGVPLFAVLLVNSGVTHGLRRHFLSTAFGSSRAFCLLVIVLLLWRLGVAGTAEDVVLAHLVVIVGVLAVQFAVLSRILDRMGDGTSDGADHHEVAWLKSSCGLLVVSLTSSYLADLAVLAASPSATAEQLAVLNAVLRTAALLLFVVAAVDHVVLPEFSTSFTVGDDEQLRRVVLRATRVRLGAVAGGAAALLVAGPSILGLFGPGFDVGYRPLVVAIAGLLARAAAGGAPQLVAATTGTKPLVAASLAGLVVGLGLAIAIIRTSPVMGGAVAFGSATAATAWMSRSICIRRLGLDPSIVGLLQDARRT